MAFKPAPGPVATTCSQNATPGATSAAAAEYEVAEHAVEVVRSAIAQLCEALLFAVNHSETDEATVQLPFAGHDLLTGAAVSDTLTLTPLGVAVVRGSS